VRLVVLPGAFRPLSDSWQLRQALRRTPLPHGARTLDLCTGSGLVAIGAVRDAAARATAVDVSRRALLTTRINARLNGVRVDARRGDLFAPVQGERFHAITANPPYVPSEDPELPRRGASRAWDAGTDGRVLLDRICAEAPDHLEAGGTVLLVHSDIIGIDRTVALLEHGGLDVEVEDERTGPLGPLMRDRVEHLEAQGLLPPGREEEVVAVIRGRRPALSRRRRPAGPATAAAASPPDRAAS
jgi:release factor glutamine methyltransferase